MVLLHVKFFLVYRLFPMTKVFFAKDQICFLNTCLKTYKYWLWQLYGHYSLAITSCAKVQPDGNLPVYSITLHKLVQCYLTSPWKVSITDWIFWIGSYLKSATILNFREESVFQVAQISVLHEKSQFWGEWYSRWAQNWSPQTILDYPPAPGFRENVRKIWNTDLFEFKWNVIH